MAESGQINLNKVTASYSIKDIELVDRRDLESANETRLYAELSSALAVGLIGNAISNPTAPLIISAILFSLFGAFMIYKFIGKNQKIISQVSNGDASDAGIQQKILNLLYSDLGLTIEELMEKLKLDYASIKIVLKKMVTNHFVKFQTISGKTFYFLYEKENEFYAAHPTPDKANTEDLPF